MKSIPLPAFRDSLPWSKTLPLDDFERTVATLDVEDGEVVAVIHDDQVTGVLLPARHCVHVLGEDEDPHDLLPRDVAARAGVREDEMEPLLPRLRNVPSRARLLRLDTGPLPVMSWTAPGEGYYRAHVDSPARFYSSFLRHSEDLPQDRFAAIAGALVGECLARTETGEVSTEDKERRWRERAGQGLSAVGMRLEDFEVVRAEAITEVSAPHPESSASRPSLARHPRSG